MRKFLTLAFAAQVALYASSFEGHAEGAFALGESGSTNWVGWSGNHQTKAEARSAAMRDCLSRGPHCEIKFMITNTCFAIARVVGDSRHSSAVTRPTERQAQADALSQCFSRTGRPCQAQSFCDTIDENARLAVERQREQYQQQQIDQQRAAANANAVAIEQRRISAVTAAADAAEQRRISSEYEAQQAEQRRAAANAAVLVAEQRRISVETVVAEAERRANAAEQSRIVAETAAAEAERRANAASSRIFLPPESQSYLKRQSVPVNTISILAGAFLVLIWLVSLTKRSSTPLTIKGLVGITVPIAQSLIFYYLGVGDSITLAEISILSWPFGVGEVVLALSYRPQLA